jgi:iron complex transport system permease protein
LLAIVLLFLVIALGVSVGELSIPLQNVFYAISNKMGLTEVPLNRIYESVIWDFRLSRALVAACCGAGLAICGAVLQSLLKNALAEPYVLGVSAGASTGAVRRGAGHWHRGGFPLRGRLCRGLRRLRLCRLSDQRRARRQ